MTVLIPTAEVSTDLSVHLKCYKLAACKDKQSFLFVTSWKKTSHICLQSPTEIQVLSNSCLRLSQNGLLLDKN